MKRFIVVCVVTGVLFAALYQGCRFVKRSLDRSLLAEPRIIEGPCYDPETMNVGLIDVPKSATNIRLRCGGVSGRLKCTIKESDFRAYAHEQGWVLRSDTVLHNARTGAKMEYDYSESVRRYFDPGRKLPKRFLSYNYVQSNNGGCAVLYDRDDEILYVDISLN